MRIRFSCNAYFNGNIYKHGEICEIADSEVALNLKRRGLVEALDPADMPEIEPKPAQNAPQTKKASKTPSKPKVAKKGAK